MYMAGFFTSAPQDPSSPITAECFTLLDALNIPYERIEHDPADTPEVCDAVRKKLNLPICKNLFLCNRQKTAFYLVTMPEDKPFSAKEVGHQIGSSRLSFAKPEYMLEYLDITPGSVSVLGLMNDKENKVQLLIDEDVLKGEFVGMHPCINTSSLRLKTDDLVNKVIPAMGHEPRIVTLGKAQDNN